MASIDSTRLLLNLLKRVSAKGEVTREDLGHSPYIFRSDRELKCEITAVGRIGQCDP